MRFNTGEVITAMVTPMTESGAIDYEKIEQLSEYLTQNGSDAIVVTGTTGESPTLTHEEEIKILHAAQRGVKNGAKIIMGTGSNSTATAVEMSKLAEQEGADAILCVVPYYNKPSQQGMIEHFSAIAEAVNLPIILYNIPSRTGVNMAVNTVKYLAEKYNNIAALKQSFADMDMVTELRMNCPEDFVILSGDDSLTLPMMSLGVHGVISVASHLFGKEIKSMITEFKSGNIKSAREMHNKLYPSFRKLFMAPNPVPVKAALAKEGRIEEYTRKPLIGLTDSEKTELFDTIEATKASLSVLL